MKDAVILHYLACLSVAVLVTACGSQPPAPTTAPTEPPTTITPTEIPPLAAPGEFSETLAAAQQLLQQGLLVPAAGLLDALNQQALNEQEQAQFNLLTIRLYYLQGDITAASNVAAASLAALPMLAADSRWQLQQWQMRLLQYASTLASARYAERILTSITSPEQRAVVMAHIWHSLQRTGANQLDAALPQAIEPHWRGWLELALVAAGVTDSPDVQAAEVELWLQKYPSHPAATAMPGGLNFLTDLASAVPSRVALLLPFGNALTSAASAVLEGYMAALFNAQQQGWESADVLVLDMQDFADINAAYAAAVAQGADLVIGPLSREALTGWLPDAQYRVPLLALNWLPRQPGPGQPQPLLYQLALAPEDEGRQLAQLAFDQGARRALVMQPAGVWGDTVADSFQQQWLQQQGSTAATAVYANRTDYSPALQSALQLDLSEKRAARVRQLMDTRVEFTPRRRQDVDSVILLAGTPAEARSINPLFAFHYAGDLPVYAISSIYSGQQDPERDHDLNGIHLLEIPWLLTPENPVRELIEAAGGKQTLAAMHALGADAFLLHWRLRQLQASPQNSVRGHTGLLHMDASGRIHRQLQAAQIDAGIPVAQEQ